VCGPSTEGRMKGLADAARLKCSGPDQEDHVDKIAHKAVGGRSRERISVKFFRELLLTLDHGNLWRRTVS